MKKIDWTACCTVLILALAAPLAVAMTATSSPATPLPQPAKHAESCGLQVRWSGTDARAELSVCGQPLLVLEQKAGRCKASDALCNSMKNMNLYAEFSSAGNVLCVARRTEDGRLSWNDSCKTCASHSGNCAKRPA